MSTSRVPHAKEVSVHGGDWPADILLLAWDKGKDVCVDITITSPTSLDACPYNIDGARRHLNAHEKEKRSKQLAQCEGMGWGHHPAAYSPWGGQGTAAKSLLFEVGHGGPAGMAKGATNPGAEAKLIAQPCPGSCTPTLTSMPSPGCPRNLTDTQLHAQKAQIEACQPPK